MVSETVVGMFFSPKLWQFFQPEDWSQQRQLLPHDVFLVREDAHIFQSQCWGLWVTSVQLVVSKILTTSSSKIGVGDGSWCCIFIKDGIIINFRDEWQSLLAHVQNSSTIPRGFSNSEAPRVVFSNLQSFRTVRRPMRGSGMFKLLQISSQTSAPI